jgi:hypothetical protein
MIRYLNGIYYYQNFGQNFLLHASKNFTFVNGSCGVLSFSYKSEGKLASVYAIKAYRGRGGTIPLIRNLGSRGV